MYSRKEIEKKLSSFDKFMTSSEKSPEDKLIRVIEQCLYFEIQNSLYELYRKLINDPIYRGNGTFENFAVNLTDKEKFSMIKLIENLCKNDEIFNNEEKITSYFNIQWVENSKLNSAIKQELGIISYEYDNRTN